MRQHQGFTLIELIVVITIIGVLGGAVAISTRGPTDGARMARIRADFATITQAAHMFRMEQGRVPDSIGELMSPPPRFSGDDSPYFEEEPIDPWGGEYALDFEGRKPLVRTFGPDGIEGTEDDISSRDLALARRRV